MRAFNAREGFTVADDTLPPRLFEDRLIDDGPTDLRRGATRRSSECAAATSAADGLGRGYGKQPHRGQPAGTGAGLGPGDHQPVRRQVAPLAGGSDPDQYRPRGRSPGRLRLREPRGKLIWKKDRRSLRPLMVRSAFVDHRRGIRIQIRSQTQHLSGTEPPSRLAAECSRRMHFGLRTAPEFLPLRPATRCWASLKRCATL